jgi:hypothetical protein
MTRPLPPEEFDMESPREFQESKHLRWTGRPSEEQLLGPAAPPSAKPIISFQPPPLHDWAIASMAVPDTSEPPRWRRFGGRDLIALGAVTAAVWFAVSGSNGLPFHASSTADPAKASELVGTTVSVDRGELGSLPRKAATEGTAANSSGDRGVADGVDNGGSGHKRSPKPPPSGAQSDPLLQADLPVVGPVTVEKPEVELPPVSLPAGTTSLPLAGTPTLPTVTLPTLP